MPQRRRSPRTRTTRAALLLLVIAACLVAVLTLLPPRRGEAPGQAAGEATGQIPEAGQAARERPERPGEAPRTTPREPPAHTPAGSPPERPARVGRLAVVIDDVGYSLESLQPFLDSRLPLSLSVLPGLPHSAEAARRVRSAGKELLLHLPMEASNGADPGPVAVLRSMSDGALRELLAASLAEIPADGVNNHMGSSATADARVMRIVLGFLKEKGLYFLDSRTTASSVAVEVAGEIGEPVLKRDVFLDNEPAAEAILAELRRGLELAEQRGQAVLIGHVQNPQLVGLLEQVLPELERRGLQLVSAGSLAAPREERAW